MMDNMPSHMRLERQRMNWMGSIQAEIAVENYYSGKCQFNEMQTRAIESFDELQQAYDEIAKRVMTTIMFSAAAIEALINDYAASCLGDEEFYESFDKLRVLDKFSLIVQFIYRKPWDKGQAYYSSLHALYKERNKLAHPKTIEVPDNMWSDNEPHGCSDEEYENRIEKLFQKMVIEYKNDAKKEIRRARDAIKTMYNITKYMDDNDSNAHATLRLLIPQIIEDDERPIVSAKENVYTEIGIPIQRFILSEKVEIQ